MWLFASLAMNEKLTLLISIITPKLILPYFILRFGASKTWSEGTLEKNEPWNQGGPCRIGKNLQTYGVRHSAGVKGNPEKGKG